MVASQWKRKDSYFSGDDEEYLDNIPRIRIVADDGNTLVREELSISKSRCPITIKRCRFTKGDFWKTSG